MSLARLGGTALALGLFASATATAAGTAGLYEVEPANPLAAWANDDAETPRFAEDDDGEMQRRKRAREAAVTTILGHNPFCDDCPPPTPETAPGTKPPAALVASAPPAVQILATMESTDPDRSLATVYDPIHGTWAAGLGDALAPGVVLAAIGPGQVTYSRGDTTGVLRVGAGASSPVKPSKEPKRPSTTVEKPNPQSALSDRVSCDAGSRCTIERSVIQEVLANPSKLGGIRAFPSSGGFKLAGIRRGSLAHEIGLRNGDVLTEVGGKPLDSLDDALALLPLLRSASNVHVTLSRKGKPITHEIEIV
ncbi:MAG: PDZ domain-containing protein [Nannocystaceae bacterium]|nr:PDZ domain-containing protein [Nannocystaceae bacterium]